MKSDQNFSGVTREDVMKSCGEMMFKTEMFTNVNNEYKWVSDEGASIGIFSGDYFLTLTLSELELFIMQP